MDHFERKYKTPFLQGLSLIYLTFIGNIFFIWEGSKEQLIRNLDELNKKHDSIKFEFKISKTSIFFWIQKCISRITNFTQKYIEHKPIDRGFFT